MWIAQNTLGNRIYCVQQIKSEVHRWLHHYFPINQYREVYWKTGQMLPNFVKPDAGCTDWVKKEVGFALPEPLVIRKATPMEENKFRGAFPEMERSFFNA